MLAVLMEHMAGRWPCWLSPRHVLVLPITSAQEAYCAGLVAELRAAGVHADMDATTTSLSK
jgi:threonyl-tRNA synthetase